MTRTGLDPFARIASRPPRSLWLTCYALLGAVLLYILVARWFLPLYVAGPLGVERTAGGESLLMADVGGRSGPTTRVGPADHALADDRVDPNTADWPELTRLPGIGEVIAKRIVAYREEHRVSPDQPVFRSPADLGRVRGIGPKTVESIEGQLRFEE